MINLQFCGFDSILARGISRFTDPSGTGIGHVDAVMPDGSLLGAQHEDGLGGMPSGVQIRPADYGDSCGMTNRRRVALPAGDDMTAAFYAFLRGQIGKPYNTAAIVAFITGTNAQTEGGWFCSQLQRVALETCQFFVPLWMPANKDTPADLLQVCSAFAPVLID